MRFSRPSSAKRLSAQRLELIGALGYVDQAQLLPTSTENAPAAAHWIQAWSIDQVVAGGGWSGSARWRRLTPLLAERGIAVSFAPATEGISSTELLARIRATETA